MKKLLDDEIAAGKILIGHLVNPKTYTRFSIKDGVVSSTEFTVEGRKHTLHEIRNKLLLKHKKYMRSQPDSYYESLSEKDINERLLLL